MNQNAKLKHLFTRSRKPTLINLNSIKREQTAVIDRYTFFRKNINKSILFFLWSEIGHFISTLFKYILRRYRI